MRPSELTSRHLRCVSLGDALGTVIYRQSEPDAATFVDIDTGQCWTHAERDRYRRSTAYRLRRNRIIAHRRCDACGDPDGSVLWTAYAADIGAETPENTVVLCRHCNNRAFRAREGLGLVA